MAKAFREMRNDKPLYYDRDAIWYLSYGTLQDNGYNKDTGIARVFKKTSGAKEIEYYKKNRNYKIVEEKTDDKGNTWLITFIDTTNDRKDTVSFQLGDLYAKGGGVDGFNALDLPVKYKLYDEKGNIIHTTTSFNRASDKSVMENLKIIATDKSGNSRVIREIKYAEGGSVGKKTYEITFEDVFSFAIATRTAELTEAQYNKAIEQMKSGVIVVDIYNEKKGIHEQLRIKNIVPKHAKGGQIEDCGCWHYEIGGL